MLKDPKEFLKHIQDESFYIISVTRGLNFDAFLEDETLKRAIVRSLEVIGEASKKVPSDFKSQFNVIEWKSMAGMRDRLIHNYFGINYTIVWDVVTNKIPELNKQILSIL